MRVTGASQQAARTHAAALHIIPINCQVRAGDAASAWWQVTLCDPMWHVGSRSAEWVLLASTAIRLYLYLYLNSSCSNRVAYSELLQNRQHTHLPLPVPGKKGTKRRGYEGKLREKGEEWIGWTRTCN